MSYSLTPFFFRHTSRQRSILGLLVLFFSLYSNFLLAATEEKILLRDGSEVKVKLKNGINSRSSKNGEALKAEVAEDVVVKQRVLIKEGTKVNGYVTGVERAKRLGQEGRINLVVSSTRTVDDQKAPLRALQSSRGESTTTSTMVLSLLVSPLFSLRKGKDTSIPAGTIFSAFLAEDLYIVSGIEALEAPQKEERKEEKRGRNRREQKPLLRIRRR